MEFQGRSFWLAVHLAVYLHLIGVISYASHLHQCDSATMVSAIWWTWYIQPSRHTQLPPPSEVWYQSPLPCTAPQTDPSSLRGRTASALAPPSCRRMCTSPVEQRWSNHQNGTHWSSSSASSVYSWLRDVARLICLCSLHAHLLTSVDTSLWSLKWYCLPPIY